MYKKLKLILKKSDIVQIIYNTSIYIIRKLLLFVSIILGQKNNVVMVQAYEGRQYSCNPKYIAEYLKTSSNINIVVSLKRPELYECLEKRGLKLVKKNSLSYFYCYLTSRVIIVNDFLPLLLPLKDTQISINTWHGGGAYKKVGVSLSKNNYYTQRYILQHKVNYMVSSCAAFTEIASEAFNISKYNMLPIGMPRNDLLVNGENISNINKDVKKRYSIAEDTKIVLYAPTYRESLKNSLYNLDFENILLALKQKFGGEWIFLFRGHYFLTENSKMKDKYIINVSDYDDMQELLAITDCLITDYSSSVWDFSLTLKPCFLYATDLDEYKKEIDFYYPIEKWPFALAKNNDELVANIESYNEKVYRNLVIEHHKILGSYEKGNACEKIGKMIIELCK